MDDFDSDAFFYNWTKFGPKLLSEKESQYEQHIFPLAVIGEEGWALSSWFQGYEAHWTKRRDDLTEAGDEEGSRAAAQHIENACVFGQHVRDVTEQYQISYIELDRNLEVEKVCDMFTQINSKGIQLDVFDLINALLKPKGLQLKHLWREAKTRLEFVETNKMNVYILQVMSILLSVLLFAEVPLLFAPWAGKADTRRTEETGQGNTDSGYGRLRETMEDRGRCPGIRYQATEPSTGVWRDLVELFALHLHSSSLRRASGSRQRTSWKSEAGGAAQDSPVVLGFCFRKSLLWIRRVDQRS